MASETQSEIATESHAKSQGILRGTSIVSCLTIISRILGFVRDLVFARFFGTGVLADCFFVAFRIPNVLRSMLAEGALTSAFVPVFASEFTKGSGSAEKTLCAVASALLSISALIAVIGVLLSQYLIALFAPGFDGAKADLSIHLLRIMFPYIVFVSIVAMLGGALNTLKIFGTAALGQITMNLVLISGAVLAGYSDSNAANILAWSVIVGGVVQVAVQLPFLSRAGIRLRLTSRMWTAPVRQTLILMLPAMLGAAVYQLTIVVNTMLASLLEPGSVSWLFYADRLAQLPIGVFSIALATVLLPALAKSVANSEHEQYHKNTVDALRFTSFIIAPAACGLFALSDPLVRLIFERGEFTPYASVQTSAALKAYCFGLWLLSCQTVLSRAFLARKDTVTPMLIGIVTLICNFIIAVALIGQIGLTSAGWLTEIVRAIRSMLQSIPVLGQLIVVLDLKHAGLALASGLATVLSFGMYLYLAKRASPAMQLDLFVRASIRSWLAGIVMLVAVQYVQSSCNSDLCGVLLGVGLGVVSYLGASLLLRSVECKELLKMAKTTPLLRFGSG